MAITAVHAVLRIDSLFCGCLWFFNHTTIDPTITATQIEYATVKPAEKLTSEIRSPIVTAGSAAQRSIRADCGIMIVDAGWPARRRLHAV
jgi:hypothetical protein